MLKIILMSLACCGAAAFELANKGNEPEKAAHETHFAAMKELVGSWVAKDEEGNPSDEVVLTYRLIAGGTALHEIVFPGSDHEMLTVYYLDNGKLVLDHFCILGNQPHMELQADSTATTLKFKCTRGGNLKDLKEKHMNTGTIRMIGKDQLENTWIAREDGKEVFVAESKLVRMRAK